LFGHSSEEDCNSGCDEPSKGKNCSMIVEEFFMVNEPSNLRSELMDVFHNILLINKDKIKKKLIPKE